MQSKINTSPMVNIKQSCLRTAPCLSKLIVIFLWVSSSSLVSEAIRKELKSHRNWRLLDAGDECGSSSNDRIIGGRKAKLGQYPWIAHLGYSLRPNLFGIVMPVFTCGGSIINNRYILTAAHCCPPHMEGLPDYVTAYLEMVHLGELNTQTDPDCVDGACAPPVQKIAVQEHLAHPEYTKDTRLHDICLVRLAQDIKFSRYVHPICLPVHEWFTKNEFKNYVMEVAGWGIKDIVTGDSSNILQTLNIAVVPNVDCSIAFYGRANIIDKQMCAGAVIGKDSCGGDSGGPLMASLSMNGPPRYFLVGVVSFGEESCGSKTIPGVYTRVSEYMLWVLENIKE